MFTNHPVIHSLFTIRLQSFTICRRSLIRTFILRRAIRLGIADDGRADPDPPARRVPVGLTVGGFVVDHRCSSFAVPTIVRRCASVAALYPLDSGAASRVCVQSFAGWGGAPPHPAASSSRSGPGVGRSVRSEGM